MRGRNEFLDDAVRHAKEHSKSLRIGLICGLVSGYLLGILTPKAVDKVKMWNYHAEKGNVPILQVEWPFADDLDANGKQETLIDIRGGDGKSRLYTLEFDANGKPVLNYHACGSELPGQYERRR